MRHQASEAVTTVRQAEAFQVSIPQAELDDLYDRLARTRWVDELSDDGWDSGLSISYMRELVDYWQQYLLGALTIMAAAFYSKARTVQVKE